MFKEGKEGVPHKQVYPVKACNSEVFHLGGCEDVDLEVRHNNVWGRGLLTFANNPNARWATK